MSPDNYLCYNPDVDNIFNFIIEHEGKLLISFLFFTGLFKEPSQFLFTTSEEVGKVSLSYVIFIRIFRLDII